MSSSVFDASCADGLGPNENESALTASSIESHEATDETNAAAAAAASSPLCTEVDGNLSTNTHKKKELVVNWRCFLTKAVRNGETVYKCKFCTFANEWGFVVRHVQLNHKRLKPSRRQRGVKGPSQIWTCDECNYRTPELQRMRRHHACHGASGTFKCEWCNYSSNKLIDVGKHAKWHNDVGKNFRCSSVEVQRPVPAKKAHSFVCPVCSKRCERASDLASHTRMHMDLRPFMCTKCGLRSNFKQSVKKHIRLQHDGDFSELMVELSPSEARDTIDAYRSTVSAAAIDQGKCTLPAELDTDVKRLGTLVEQQDGNASTPDEFLNSASNSCDNRRRDNMFKCKKCGFRTCVRKNMKSHVRNMHGITKSKASIIRVCLSKTQNAKKFRKYQKSDSRQMRVGGDGGDIKKFVCHVCSRACVSASKLRKHISIHTDLKPYKCSHCGLRCNFKENLKTHVRKVHGFENEEAYIVILSPTEAKTTVDDYNRSRVQTAAVHKSPHSATTAAAAAESGNGSLRGAAGRSEKHGNITDRAEDDEPCADDDRNRLRGSSASQQHHVCGVCSKTCESADDLQRHRVSHSDVKRFMCRLCGMRTNFKGNMTKHARNKHGADDASDLLIELPLIDDKETLDTCDSEKVNSTVEEGNGDLSSSKICTPEPLTKMHPSLCENGGNSSGSSQPDVAAHNKSDNSNNDLRRYKCSVCGYRSNFRTNVRKHLLNLHRVGNVPRYIVALSVSEAADTIDAYRLERDVKGGGRARPVSAAKSDGIGTRRPMTARKTRRVVSAAEQVTGISHPVDESGAAERDPVNGAAPEMTIDVSERKSTEDGGGTDVITTGSVDGSVPEVDEAVSYIGMDEVATVANLGRFMCSECDYRAFTPAGVYKHRQRHHPEARTITLTSDEAYRSYMATRSQLADQNGFRQTSGASVDKSRRVDLLPYVCGGCGRRTKSLKTMKRHIKDQHRGAAKVIRLSAEEAERSLAGYHAKFGSSSPSVHAEDGDATAASASSRRRGSRPAALPSCDRSTVTYDGQHLRRFACSHCPQRSNYRRTIAYHININHPESGATVRMLPEEEARATLKAYNSLVYSRDSSVKLNAGLPRKSSSATKSKKYAVPPSADVKLADDADADMGGGRHRKRSDVRLPESDAIGDSSFDASWSDACENPNAPFGYSIDGSYFVCNICPYRAVRLYHLESHQRMHVERPKCKLKCSYCPYFTSHPSFLKQHLLLHEGSPSTVTAASALEEIVGRTVVGSPSSGEKPSVFVCDHCPYMSKYRTKMISHKQLHRQRASAPFKCSLCPLWMADRRCVRRHMLVHEPDYAETWYRSAPSAERPVKLCVPDVEVEPEIIETTAIKLKLIANRCGSATAARGPTRRVGSSPSKPQKNESSVSGHPGSRRWQQRRLWRDIRRIEVSRRQRRLQLDGRSRRIRGASHCQP